MTALDPWSVVSLLVGAAFGSSGIVAWMITYYQIKEGRRQRAQENFSHFVITPSFLHFMGLLSELSSIFGSIHNQQDLKKFLPQINNLLPKITDERAKMILGGLPILYPPKFLATFDNVENLVVTMGNLALESRFEVVQQIFKTFVAEAAKLSRQLRSVLGFYELK
jgi:hypothetical protein